MPRNLCCLLDSTMECIGCNLRVCMGCFKDTATRDQCSADYAESWGKDEFGHAWGSIENVEWYREAEMMARGRPKLPKSSQQKLQ